MMRKSIISIAGLLFCAAADGQNLFVNGFFEYGDWSGWTVTPTCNGQTCVQTVELYDMDGPGPLKESLAGRLSVGKVSLGGSAAGICMTQSLNLHASEMYSFYAEVSSYLNTTAYPGNLDGGQYYLMVDDIVIDSWMCGEILKMEKKYYYLSGAFTPLASGYYEVGLKIVRDWLPDEHLSQYIDNVMCMVPEPTTATVMIALLALRRR